MKKPYLIFLFSLTIFTTDLSAQNEFPKNSTQIRKSNRNTTARTAFTPFIKEVKIFPDELTSYLYIHVAGQSTSKANIIIKNLEGRIVLNDNLLVGQTEKFCVNHLPRGQYQISILISGFLLKNQIITLI